MLPRGETPEAIVRAARKAKLLVKKPAPVPVMTPEEKAEAERAAAELKRAEQIKIIEGEAKDSALIAVAL